MNKREFKFNFSSNETISSPKHFMFFQITYKLKDKIQCTPQLYTNFFLLVSEKSSSLKFSLHFVLSRNAPFFKLFTNWKIRFNARHNCISTFFYSSQKSLHPLNFHFTLLYPVQTPRTIFLNNFHLPKR